MSDLTDQRTVELELKHDALHDSLTGLCNRVLLIDRINQVFQRAVRDPGLVCAVLFLDIDRFKVINDSLGHDVGDQLLIGFASRLSEALRPGDTVARLGGDEFAVLLTEAGQPGEAVAVAERLHRALEKTFSIDGHELVVKTRLREAIDHSLLRVYYQPIVDLTSGRICAIEALVRWPEDWEPVSPSDFIPIAEEAGLVGALGLHVLRTALGTLAVWRRSGLVTQDVPVSVNVSGRQLDDPGLAGHVRTAITDARLRASSLLLEITEDTLMHEPERMQAILTQLCTTGVGLHLDDFGTGHSSVSALHQYPVGALKIDRAFVTSMSRTTLASEVVVRSTVALAHGLGINVISEGIEYGSQLRRLRALGCELGQGFLFSEPLSRRDTETLLKDWQGTWSALLRLPRPSTHTVIPSAGS